MRSTRATVLHADLDAFYASVEQRDRPALRGKPMAVGGGIILAASYEARAMGVRTPMNLRAAKRLCPKLIVVDPRMEAYSEASRQVFEIFEQTTPLVEPISMDEAFLDVAGLGRLAGSPEDIAKQLRRRVSNEVGLAISVGIARTKFLAKVASGVSKPDGLLLVDPVSELDFLHPLGVRNIWGVGPKSTAKLAAKGITTVGQVASLTRPMLTTILGGAAGEHLHALARNHDPRPVETGKRRSSIGSQRALGQRHRPFEDLEAVLLELVDRVTRRLRQSNRVGKTVSLRFRFGDFTRDTRSQSLPQASDSTALFLRAAQALLRARRREVDRRRLTLLGFTISNLSPNCTVQQALPFDNQNSPSLDSAVDLVREKYGSASISRAALVGRSTGPDVPLMPDLDS